MGVRRRLCTPKQQQKLHSPKHEALRSKLLTRLTPYSTSAFALSNGAMSRSVLSDPSLIGYKKTSDKKRDTSKMHEAKKNSNETRDTPKIQGAKKTSDEKEAPLKHNRLKKASDKKRGTPKRG
jgi:hypothetical protein